MRKKHNFDDASLEMLLFLPMFLFTVRPTEKKSVFGQRNKIKAHQYED